MSATDSPASAASEAKAALPPEASPRIARIGLWLGPAVALLIWALPSGELAPAAHRLAAITALVAIWWMTEALPLAIVSLLPLLLLPVAGVRSAEATAPAYGNDLIWLFFGGFQLAFALERWHLHRRMAAFIVRRVGTRPDRLVLGFILSAGLLSMWLMNTSVTLMLLPVTVAVAHGLEGDRPGPISAALLLGMGYAASIGGMGTYLGTAPNLVFAGMSRKFGAEVSFNDWMLICIPLSLMLLFLLWLYLTRIAFKVPRTALTSEAPAIAELLAKPAPWSSAEKRMAVIFALVVAAWVFGRPVFGALGYPPNFLSDSTVAMFAAVLVWLVPAGGGQGPLLRWTDSAHTPWPILLLFGGGLALANAFEDTGLSAWLGSVLADVTAGLPFPLVMLVVVVLIAALSEVASNVATATLMLPVVGSLAQAMGLPAAALMLPATLAASCGFMLPVATPPNAIVYATDRFRITDMTRAGFGLDLLCAVVITGWILLWGGHVLGF